MKTIEYEVLVSIKTISKYIAINSSTVQTSLTIQLHLSNWLFSLNQADYPIKTRPIREVICLVIEIALMDHITISMQSKNLKSIEKFISSQIGNVVGLHGISSQLLFPL